MNLRSVLLLLTLASAISTASAAYVTGFENPPFVSADVNGQDSWTTSANTPTARVRTASEIATDLTNAGLDPAAPVHGGSQALMVSGAGASNATIRVISGLETESVVLLDIWARPLIGGSTGNIFLTMEDSGGDRAAAFRFGTAFGNTIDYGTNIGSVWQPSTTIWDANSWYDLRMRVDYTTKTYDFSINGTQVNASPIPFYNALSDNFSQIRIFRGANQSGMIVDDLLVTIPEPGPMGFLLIGSVLLIGQSYGAGLRRT